MEETVSDEWYVRVSGGDRVPDVYIGRLPAKGVEEATLMVNKIISYESRLNSKTWERDTLLVADNQVEAYEGVFEVMNDEAAALLPTGMNSPFKGYLGDYLSGSDLTRDIKREINEGVLLVNYSGHGSTQIWASEDIFEEEDVADLSNGERLAFFVSMSCLSGYFVTPESFGADSQSLMEALLRSEGKGAVGALMPTGMSATDGQHILNNGLFEAIFTEDVRRLGEAISVAKQTLLANDEGYGEVSETFLLFGDPAMELKVPLPRRPVGVEAEGKESAIELGWQGAKDCNGGEVSGYNLYRGTSSGGGYTKVNSSLITGTGYEDSTVVNGITYYYVVTSVDSEGYESVRSEEVSGRAVAPKASAPVQEPSPSPLSSGGGGGGGCFITTIGGYLP
jgi:hypothetical protein